MIVQHKGKLKIKEIEKISSEGDVLSNYFSTNRYPSLNVWWALQKSDKDELQKQFEVNHRIHGFEIALLFGKPNCHMRGYESYPGAWVFYDTEYNVRWLVFSDGIRKGHFKGTSYEVTITENFPEDQFKSAIKKFFNHFGCVPLDNKKQVV